MSTSDQASGHFREIHISKIKVGTVIRTMVQWEPEDIWNASGKQTSHNVRDAKKGRLVPSQAVVLDIATGENPGLVTTYLATFGGRQTLPTGRDKDGNVLQPGFFFPLKPAPDHHPFRAVDVSGPGTKPPVPGWASLREQRIIPDSGQMILANGTWPLEAVEAVRNAMRG